jgi:sulfur-oxidizing protein SoxZ
MADPMRIRANVDANGVTEVKVLMNHEMETGQRKDAQGKTIPAWFIQEVNATWNGKTVLSAQWGPAVSKNPFLSFKFNEGNLRCDV